VQLGGLRERCKLPQRGLGSAEIEFDALQPENLTSAGTNFSFSLTLPKKIFSPDPSMTTEIP